MSTSHAPALGVALRQAAALHSLHHLAVVRLEADGEATVVAVAEGDGAEGPPPAAAVANALEALGAEATYAGREGGGAVRALRLTDRRHVLIAWAAGDIEAGPLAETGDLVTALLYENPGGVELDHARLFRDLAADPAPLGERLVASLARGADLLGMGAGVLLCVEAEEWCVEAVHDPQGLLRIDPLLASGGLASLTYRANGAVGLHDVSQTPYEVPEGVRSFLGAPIVAGRQGIGVLVFLGGEARPGPFSDPARGLAETLARWAGVALHARTTERRAAAHENALRRLLDASPAAAGMAEWVSSSAGSDDLVLTDANDAAVRLLGVGPGDSLSEALAPAGVRLWTGACRRAVDDAAPQRFRAETTPPGADGAVRLVVSLTMAEPPEAGRPARVVFMAEDVTARRLVRDHLHEREAQLRSLLERAPVMLFEVDEAGRFTFAEGRALALSGARPADLVGTSVFERYHYSPEATQAMGRVLAGEEARCHLEMGGRKLEVWATPARDRDGQVVGARGVAVDVTEKEAAERARRAAEEAAAESTHSTADLVSLLSHGLRAPLATVLGFADLLASDPDANPGESGEAISRAAEEILETLDGFMELTQMSAMRTARPSAVGEAGVRAGLKRALAEAGVAVDLDLAPLAQPVLLDLRLVGTLLQRVASLADGPLRVDAAVSGGNLFIRLASRGLAEKLSGDTLDTAHVHHAAAALGADLVVGQDGSVGMGVPAPEAPVVVLSDAAPEPPAAPANDPGDVLDIPAAMLAPADVALSAPGFTAPTGRG